MKRQMNKVPMQSLIIIIQTGSSTHHKHKHDRTQKLKRWQLIYLDVPVVDYHYSFTKRFQHSSFMLYKGDIKTVLEVGADGLMGSAPTCCANVLRAIRVRIPARGPFPIQYALNYDHQNKYRNEHKPLPLCENYFYPCKKKKKLKLYHSWSINSKSS